MTIPIYSIKLFFQILISSSSMMMFDELYAKQRL